MQGRSKSFFLICLMLSALGSPILFQNCTKMQGPQEEDAPSVDYGNGFNRPAQVCGREGYRYLRDRYFKFHCAHCHDGSIQFDPERSYLFGSLDLETSYQEMLRVPADVLVETSTNNSFCGTRCNLTDGDPILADIRFWLLHPTTCP